MASSLVRVACFMVGCFAIYIAVFMYEAESGRLQNRIEELWVTISDRAILVGSRTVALFSAVAVADTRMLNRIYGKRLISFRMVGISTITSLSVPILFVLVANPFSARTGVPGLPRDDIRFWGIVLVILVLLTAPAFMTRSRFAVALTLLPFSFCVAFWILSPLMHDRNAGWSNVTTTAILASLLSDVAVAALIRQSINIIGRQVRIPRILAMLCLQALCIPTFTLLPAIVGYILDRPHYMQHHSDTVSTLYFISAMNLTTVLLSVRVHCVAGLCASASIFLACIREGHLSNCRIASHPQSKAYGRIGSGVLSVCV